MTDIDIAESIAGVLAKQWPERTIYRDFCPSNFDRPSFFLWITKSGFKDVNLATVEWEVSLQLEIFCATDQYDESSTEELRQEQSKVCMLFSAPKTKVSNPDTEEERFVEIDAKADGQEPGSAFVLFTAKWTDLRPGTTPDTAPTMKEYTLRTGAAERKRTT